MDNRLFFMLSKAENSLKVYIKQQLTKAGLKVSPGQLGILFLLRERNSRTMSELSRALETDNSAVTRTVDRLEKSGFVKRKMNEKDRRQFFITITESGITETVKASTVIDAVNKKIDSEFYERQIEIFKEVLSGINLLFKSE
ncbi:MarR family transcriptional regulator [Desulfoluna sp.]|uniref:MarR family winged helix-turn-helix transcriptional regulator n=1 Tax=Desulfoluna sp. TaxID=2045199 RepID=UPI002605D85B|nr:MarR family transcriptional regulator [Desulfoluna sp.]